MKDDLKEYADTHRDSFEQPSTELNIESLWVDIESRLDAAEKKHVIFPWKPMLRVAAAITLLAVVALGYYVNSRRVATEANGIALHNISEELAETEAFYSSEITEKMNLLEVADGSLTPEIRQQLDQMDADYDDLKNDLQDRADNEEVINAMIEYYRLKLDLLERILDEIQDKKNENTSSDETRTI